MSLAKQPLPVRRKYEPLEELSPLPSTVSPPVETEEKPAGRKITLNLEGEVDAVLQKFMEDHHLTQTGVINWAIKAAIEAYEEGTLKAEFRPGRNRIVSAR